MADKTPDLTEEEAREILKDLARNSPSAIARISAIRILREWEDRPSLAGSDEFAKLYELGGTRQSKAGGGRRNKG